MRALIAAMTALSINDAAAVTHTAPRGAEGYLTQQVKADSFIETVCMTEGAEPLVVMIRANPLGTMLRGGDAKWVKARSEVVTDKDNTIVFVTANNVGGKMTVMFQSRNTNGLVMFELNNGRKSHYDATCASIVIE